MPNFHESEFEYYNCELEDVEEQPLGEVLIESFRIIEKAKQQNVGVVVHW